MNKENHTLHSESPNKNPKGNPGSSGGSSSGDKKKPGSGSGPGKGKTPPFNFYWIYGLLALLFIALQFYNWGGTAVEISQQRFENQMLKSGDLEKILVINREMVEVFIREDRINNYEDLSEQGVTDGPHFTFKIGSVDNFVEKVDEAQAEIPANERVPIFYEQRKDWGSDILSWLLPIGLLIVFWIFIMRRMAGGAGGGQIFNIGKSKAQVYDKDTRVNVNFNHVAGLDEAKIELMEIVDFLKNPTKYTDLGGQIPKGALLVGPPGTGKTLLAKAVAGEAQVPFFSLSGSDFVEMFVGVGASRVRDLFKQAKEKAPCIIFIDEIDAIGRARGKNAMTGANDERENTLNQLLTEMDGFGTNVGVIILAATNRADILDRALLRAGRFDRQIQVEMPDLEERKAIFKVHMKPIKLGEGVEPDFMARQTPGFSGADIANVCNEAALIAARRNKKAVDKQDFMDAVDRIIGGLEKRNKIISPHEKKVVAFHESGHAATSWLLEHAHPLVKVTIVPRGKALGAAWYLPEERQLTTYEQMFDEITSALGGRAAERLVFDRISTGALNDLEKVTKQAFAMVAYFGLNSKVGNLSYYDSSGQNEYSFHKPYSEKTAELIDHEVKSIIDEAYQRSLNILTENRDKLEILANLLLEKEVIFREDLEKIFGKRPYGETETYPAGPEAEVEGLKENKAQSNHGEKPNGTEEAAEKEISDPGKADNIKP